MFIPINCCPKMKPWSRYLCPLWIGNWSVLCLILRLQQNLIMLPLYTRCGQGWQSRNETALQIRLTYPSNLLPFSVPWDCNPYPKGSNYNKSGHQVSGEVPPKYEIPKWADFNILLNTTKWAKIGVANSVIWNFKYKIVRYFTNTEEILVYLFVIVLNSLI